MKRFLSLAGLAYIVAIVLTVSALGQQSVFFRYLVPEADSPAELVKPVEQALEQNGYQIEGNYTPGQPSACSMESRLIVASHPDDVDQLLSANSQTGPFDVTTRILIYEDQSGVYLASVNPFSTLPTVLMDAAEAEFVAARRMHRLRTSLGGVTDVAADPVSYGQRRKKGYIGKTMGVMAGGAFQDKIDVVYETSLEPAAVAELLLESFGIPDGDFDLDIRYSVELPDERGFLIGVSGSPLESRSFDIVREGNDDTRSGYPCAGIAHGASYPIELYVAADSEGTEIRIVSAMYRMKMFFEDAGKWAFMKNMGMPGSIADEISDRIRFSLDGAGPGTK